MKKLSATPVRSGLAGFGEGIFGAGLYGFGRFLLGGVPAAVGNLGVALVLCSEDLETSVDLPCAERPGTTPATKRTLLAAAEA
jgi:hypothetical protein